MMSIDEFLFIVHKNKNERKKKICCCILSLKTKEYSAYFKATSNKGKSSVCKYLKININDPNHRLG